tara:strand:- start:3183 stop:3350 length:168 start_codon:yes stop_codon:yes gene_type:complete
METKKINKKPKILNINFNSINHLKIIFFFLSFKIKQHENIKFLFFSFYNACFLQA